MRKVLLASALFAAGVALGAWLHRQATSAELSAVAAGVARLSNSWDRASLKAGDDASGSGPLRVSARELSAASNTLAAAQARLIQATDELKAFQAELERRQSRLNESEAQRMELSRKLDALAVAVAARDGEMEAMRKRLTLAEDDRDFMVKEFKRLHQATADMALGTARKPARQ